MADLILDLPDMAPLVDYLARVTGRGQVIDLGARIANHSAHRPYRLVGMADPPDLIAFGRRFPGAELVPWTLHDPGGFRRPEGTEVATTIIVFVVHHHDRDRRVIDQLIREAQEGALVVIGSRSNAPLSPLGVDVRSLEAVSGPMMADNFTRARSGHFIILDKAVAAARATAVSCAVAPRPLGIVSAYNDADIIEAACTFHLDQGIDLHVIDNWSSDGTYEAVQALARRHPDRVACEQFPPDGPSAMYEWARILDRKAAVAAAFPGRWIVHIDSDELRLSPWRDLNLSQALLAAARAGTNVVDFAVLNFSPTMDGFSNRDKPLTFFTHFAFGRHASYFSQCRAWIQPAQAVDLSSSGGHDVQFEGRRVFPYRFVLLHYPIRSEAQGRRKVFVDRRRRFMAEERETRGWHVHYDFVADGESFLRSGRLLEPFSLDRLYGELSLEVISDVVRQRNAGSLIRQGYENDGSRRSAHVVPDSR